MIAYKQFVLSKSISTHVGAIMADTVIQSFPEENCSDCNQKGNCTIKHRGDLVPSGATGVFCDHCWSKRQVYFRQYGEVLALGCNLTYDENPHVFVSRIAAKLWRLSEKGTSAVCLVGSRIEHFLAHDNCHDISKELADKFGCNMNWRTPKHVVVVVGTDGLFLVPSTDQMGFYELFPGTRDRYTSTFLGA